MNIGELKQQIANLPDETPVVVDMGVLNQYFQASSLIITCLVDETRGYIRQDFGEETTPEIQYGKRTKAFLIV